MNQCLYVSDYYKDLTVIVLCEVFQSTLGTYQEKITHEKIMGSSGSVMKKRLVFVVCLNRAAGTGASRRLQFSYFLL